MKKEGFTLLEIVVVIALTAIIMVTVFQALSRVKENESRVQQHKNDEKTAYLLFHRLSPLLKNLSSHKVFNGRQMSHFFRGTNNNMFFLSRAPLVSPNRSLYIVEIRLAKGQILYREKKFQEPKQGKPALSAVLQNEPFLPLLENVKHFFLQYYSWDEGRKDFVWKKSLDTFKKDQLPEEIMLLLWFKGREYQYRFSRIILDNNQEVPGDLFR